ncbi:DUF5812 family protein [Haloarchaeobius amylolyticus]|uniref:DUF5812 family protein n=1 Tax=Haloarchaeobius amylolyticus TaxID=1198296 RepID=UPI0022704363|nr:DUF5812 family protein [Haloarchaeobius amylolyticus]
MSEKTATFLVTEADEGSVVLRDVDTGQIHTIDENDGYERHQVVGATIAPVPPMEVVWEVVEEDFRRTVELVDSDLSPTTQAMDIAADQSVGEVERVERAGTGEIHVLSVPPEDTEQAAADVLEDPETIARAARVQAVRVEVRRSVEEGVLNVRYLPD